MKKPSAADRTVPLFQEPQVEAPEEAAEDRGERKTIEEDVERLRDKAFLGQTWASKHFASTESDGNDFRVSYKDKHYYVETILRQSGKGAYGYTGIMVHERDLYKLVTVMVEAVRAKQAREQ